MATAIGTEWRGDTAHNAYNVVNVNGGDKGKCSGGHKGGSGNGNKGGNMDNNMSVAVVDDPNNGDGSEYKKHLRDEDDGRSKVKDNVIVDAGILSDKGKGEGNNNDVGGF